MEQHSDLSQHRVLIVGVKSHGLLLLRTVLGIAGVHRTIHIQDGCRALEMLQTEQFSAVFVGQIAGPPPDEPFAVAARRTEGVLNPMIPIFVLKERASLREVERARDQGVTDVLTPPISPRTIVTKLRAAFHAPRPFIVSYGFFGPDRRGGGRPPWYGHDRRGRPVRKARLDLKPRIETTLL